MRAATLLALLLALLLAPHALAQAPAVEPVPAEDARIHAGPETREARTPAVALLLAVVAAAGLALLRRGE